MATSRANLDQTQYVKIADAGQMVLLQSHRDVVRVVFSDVKPSLSNKVFHELGGENEPLTVKYTDTDVYALAMTNRSSLTVTTFVSPVISDSLPLKRVRTVELSQAEFFTATGKRFFVQYDAEYANNETKYILYQMPDVASGTVVALQQRQFKSLDGSAELEILWDSTGVVPGTPLPSFNQNRNYESDTGSMIVSVIAPPATDGVIRESDFLIGSGQGNSSAGDIALASGSRMYSPGSFFIAKVTNLENSTNRISITYDWVEFPLDSIV